MSDASASPTPAHKSPVRVHAFGFASGRWVEIDPDDGEIALYGQHPSTDPECVCMPFAEAVHLARVILALEERG